MKHRLGLLLTAPLLVACGASAHHSSSGGASAAEVGYHVLTLVSSPNGGGVPTTSLTWLRNDDEASQFAAQFAPDLQAQLHRALAAPAVPTGGALFAAVVAVGCDVPGDVSAMTGLNGPVVSAAPAPTPKASCPAPITTVAVVSGPTP